MARYCHGRVDLRTQVTVELPCPSQVVERLSGHSGRERAFDPKVAEEPALFRRSGPQAATYFVEVWVLHETVVQGEIDQPLPKRISEAQSIQLSHGSVS